MPTEKPKFKKGTGRIYETLKIKCQPVAINSGFVWPKNQSLLTNKKIIISILQPIGPNLIKAEFLNLLENIKKGSPKKTVTININLYESTIASDLEKIQNENKNCSIGSYPYFNYISKTGGVNIVISSWELDNLNPIVAKITTMVSLLGGKSSIV